MFGNRVAETTLTTRLADHAFPSITADSFRDDKTLLATARALFVPRGGEFYGFVADYKYDEFDSDGNRKAWLSIYLDDHLRESSVVFFNIRRTEQLDEAFGILDEVIAERGFTSNEEGVNFMANFFRDKKVAIYNNQAAKQSVIAMSEISMYQWHTLVSGITACYAQWNTERGKYTEEEIKMLRSLADPSMGVDDYMDALEQIASKIFDFQTEAKRFYLDGFEKRAVEGKIRSLRDQAEGLMSNIRDYQERLKEYYDRKAGVDALLNAALNGGSDVANELMEYFIANKKLFVDSVSSDDNLFYYVGGYIDNFDVEVFERCIENDSSVLYRRYDSISPSDITKEDYIALMKAVFLDEKIKMKVFSKWKIGTGGYIEAVCEDNPPMQLKDHLPNPHLMYYRCYGSFEPDLMKAARECDYVRAVDISSAENGNVNFNDVTVMEKFIRDILTKNNKFLELPDGTAATSTEAIEWLKAQDEQA